jgi:hypothetical protein
MKLGVLALVTVAAKPERMMLRPRAWHEYRLTGLARGSSNPWEGCLALRVSLLLIMMTASAEACSPFCAALGDAEFNWLAVKRCHAMSMIWVKRIAS